MEQVRVWQITAQPDFLHGRRIEDIQKLIYGTVPAGYTKRFPDSGAFRQASQPEKAYFSIAAVSTRPPPLAISGFTKARLFPHRLRPHVGLAGMANWLPPLALIVLDSENDETVRNSSVAC